MLEQHEDTKGDIRSRKWDRQYNAQENKEEKKNNVLHSTKNIDCATRISRTTEVHLCARKS